MLKIVGVLTHTKNLKQRIDFACFPKKIQLDDAKFFLMSPSPTLIKQVLKFVLFLLEFLKEKNFNTQKMKKKVPKEQKQLIFFTAGSSLCF